MIIGSNNRKLYLAKQALHSGECSYCWGPNSMRWDIAPREYHKAKKSGHRGIRRAIKQELKQL